MSNRLTPEVRRVQLLVAALRVAERKGFFHLTREAVALEAGCAGSLIPHYFGSMARFKEAVAKMAAARGLNLLV